jgi:putative SOS response-associated peptidase YedK
MCASYGLDPSVTDYENASLLYPPQLVADLRAWATANAGEVIKPTGRLKRNLHPIIRSVDGVLEVEEGWWGYLDGQGAPVKWPSINARDDSIQSRPFRANTRALVPATEWFEFQQPGKTRYSLGMDGIFTMAAITQQATTPDGQQVTCYSIVTRSPAPQLEHVHDRMPLVIPPDYHQAWLNPERKGSRELIDEALAASDAVAAELSASLAA